MCPTDAPGIHLHMPARELMVLVEFRRDQSCVRSGRFRGCSVIQFCRLWMENNRAMIRQPVITLHLFLETKELYSYGKAGSFPSGGSQPTLQLQDLWPPWGWDMLGHPIKIPPPFNDASLGFGTFLSGKCIFLAIHPQSALLQQHGLPIPWPWWPAWLLLKLSWSLVRAAAPSADGLGWHSLRGPGWGEMQKMCGGGSTEHAIIYFDWLETTREINEPPNHPGKFKALYCFPWNG